MQRWKIREAKARMSELVKCAQDLPQEITRHGKSVAVVISRETFDRLSQSEGSLLDFMRRSPLYDEAGIELTRDKSQVRELKI